MQLVLRENDLVEVPKEIGELARLRELHIQGNRLTVLPPEIGEFSHDTNLFLKLFKIDFIISRLQNYFNLALQVATFLTI